MKCDCCGKRKAFRESFAELNSKENPINLCAHCNDLLYKYRDYKKDNDEKKLEQIRTFWEANTKNSSDKFKKWREQFVDRLG